MVDIRCSMGILLRKLQKNNCDIFGINMFKFDIEELKKDGIKDISTKIPPIPLSSRTFDVAIATELIEHFLLLNKRTFLTKTR